MKKIIVIMLIVFTGCTDAGDFTESTLNIKSTNACNLSTHYYRWATKLVSSDRRKSDSLAKIAGYYEIIADSLRAEYLKSK